MYIGNELGQLSVNGNALIFMGGTKIKSAHILWDGGSMNQNSA